MIFTRRFGALAARPVFPSITEVDKEEAPELQTHDVDYDPDQASDASAA